MASKKKGKKKASAPSESQKARATEGEREVPEPSRAAANDVADAHAVPAKKTFLPLPAPLPQPVYPKESSPIDNPGTMAVVLSIVLAVLIGLTWKQGGRPQDAGGPLAAVPKESFLVARVDVPTLRASPLYAAVVGEEGPSKALGLDEIGRGCGFDPIARVDELVLALSLIHI